ncbi:MAG: hypothetical protein RL660_1322 [Bacteroidota bacterium]|jgi:cytochrome c5
MNKRFLLPVLFSFVLVVVASTSCEKAKVAFTNPGMKPWFDTYCAGCHATGASSAAKWLYDPADYDASIKTHIARIYDAVYVKKTMPPAGLSQAELSKFTDWYNAGYSAK